MLEERGAEPPVGQQHTHGRIVVTERPEHAEVRLSYVVGYHVVTLRELGYESRDGVDRLDLVADTGWDPEVVFQDDVASVAHVYEVYAVDVNEHVAGRTEALYLRVEVLRREHHVVRNDVLPVIVEVYQESVDRPDTLLDAVRDHPPLFGGYDAWYTVRWRGAILLGVQRESEGVEIDLLLSSRPAT